MAWKVIDINGYEHIIVADFAIPGEHCISFYKFHSGIEGGKMLEAAFPYANIKRVRRDGPND